LPLGHVTRLVAAKRLTSVEGKWQTPVIAGEKAASDSTRMLSTAYTLPGPGLTIQGKPL